MALFIVIPLILVVVYAFSSADGGFTLNNFKNMLTYMPVFGRSFWMAAVATVICILIGYPIAYAISLESPRVKKTLMLLVMLPMWMNFLLRTYAMMSLMEDTGIINTLLKAMGLQPIEMIGTEGAVLVGMVYNFLPFMVLPIHTSLKKMDRRVIEAAEDLGANPVEVFKRVVFPLSIPGVISGITMVFMPAVTTFAISRLLGSGRFMLYGDVIEKQFLELNNWNFGSALSLVMMVLIIISISLLNKADPKHEGGAV